MDENKTTSRRDAIKKVIQGVGVLGIGGIAWMGAIKESKSSEIVLRPPAAIDEPDFIKACIKCGNCVEACPYDTLKIASLSDRGAIGTPYFIPRDIPCYMCPDIPCVPVCPTKSLDITKLTDNIENGKPNVKNTKIGVAVIDNNACLAYWGIQCDACYRACPFIDEAITIDYQRNERTGEHATLIPKINGDICTGCGICEHVCITEKPSIRILPENIIKGKVDNHYIKGWDKSDEKRIGSEGFDTENSGKDVPAEDYLNNWEDLLDE